VGDPPLSKPLFVCLFAVGTISLTSQEVAASEFTFDCITNNSSADCSVLESQISLKIESDGSTVSFTFTNEGEDASSITDVYFQDLPPLLDETTWGFSGTGTVSFDDKCKPGDLPGGTGFTTTYCADSTAPTQQNGVNPYESLTLSYDLLNGYTLDDVLVAISGGTFNIGIHVQGFSGGGSESAVLTTVPEPASLLLLSSGAVAAAFSRRRRKTA
jgi:hypothetical protein